MSLEVDLNSQEALDAAIKMLYKSRPAKAAALLGLVDIPTKGIEPTGLEALLGAEATKVSMSPSAFSAVPPVKDIPYTQGDGPRSKSLSPNPSEPPSATPPPPTKVNVRTGTGQINEPLSPKGDIVKHRSVEGGMTVTGSLQKKAMSEEEIMAYYGGAGDLMYPTADKPMLTPSQMGAIGVGGIGLAGANRMRTKNIAARELSNIRKQYIDAIHEGSMSRKQLGLLNKELKLRGALPSLSLAPTVGIADAQMLKAERDLGSKLLKRRYKGALPLIAASLLGTAAYNQFS